MQRKTHWLTYLRHAKDTLILIKSLFINLVLYDSSFNFIITKFHSWEIYLLICLPITLFRIIFKVSLLLLWWIKIKTQDLESYAIYRIFKFLDLLTQFSRTWAYETPWGKAVCCHFLWLKLYILPPTFYMSEVVYLLLIIVIIIFWFLH